MTLIGIELSQPQAVLTEKSLGQVVVFFLKTFSLIYADESHVAIYEENVKCPTLFLHVSCCDNYDGTK